MPARNYSRDSVERALDHHDSFGMITMWSKEHVGYRVRLASGEYLELHTLREAYVFVLGLASAKQASDRKHEADMRADARG